MLVADELVPNPSVLVQKWLAVMVLEEWCLALQYVKVDVTVNFDYFSSQLLILHWIPGHDICLEGNSLKTILWALWMWMSLLDLRESH